MTPEDSADSTASLPRHGSRCGVVFLLLQATGFEGEELVSLFPVRFLARVESPMDRLEVSPIEVGIDLRRRDIRMSQHRLN